MGLEMDFGGLVRSDRVHRRIYTDPGVFDAEMTRIFAAGWVFVGHESEIPNPGDFKTDMLGRSPIILVRASETDIRLFYNACRHRGAKVCYEQQGRSRFFRCRYHGWNYDNLGRLVGVPLRERFVDFDTGKLGLLPVPRVEIYRGFIFASARTDGPSLRKYLGRGCHYLDLMCDRAPEGAIEALQPIKSDYPGNWKVAVENYTDNYHPSVLHRSALDVGVQIMGEKYGSSPITFRNAEAAYVERTYGAAHGVQDFGRSRGNIWMSAYANPEYSRLLQKKYGQERAEKLTWADMHLAIYPNLLVHLRMNNYRVVRPIAVDRTEIWTYPCRLKGAPADVNEALALNTSHHVSAMGEIQVDDLQCYSWVQEGLQAEGLEWVMLKLHGVEEHFTEDDEFEWEGASEEVIRHQYRHWVRAMSGDA